MKVVSVLDSGLFLRFLRFSHKCPEFFYSQIFKIVNKMITVVKQFTFDSAHFLPCYDGPCKNMHGHTYILNVGISGPVNVSTGMVVDFSKIKALIAPLVKQMDHVLLNDLHKTLPNFPINSTAENMVVFLSGHITQLLQGEIIAGNLPCGISLALLQLWETPTSYAEWRR